MLAKLIEPRRDRFPNLDAVMVAVEDERPDPFGDMNRRTIAIAPLDRERARPQLTIVYRHSRSPP